MMTIFPPGAKCKLRDDSIEGVIVAITICEHHVEYKVAWWDGNSRKEEWLQSFEVEGPDRATIGFKNGEGNHVSIPTQGRREGHDRK